MISPDGKTLVFSARTGERVNLYEYSLDELARTPPSVQQLTSTAPPKSHYEFSPDSKQIYFLEAGHVVSMPIESHVPKPIAVTAALDVDFDQDKMAGFEEGWKLLDKRFFDPKFNGHDWAGLRDEYAPYIAGSRNPDEMRRVMNLMIGELNSSHSGINAPRGPGVRPSAFSPAATPVGRLGLRFEREPYEAGRGLVIREVIPLGPAALEGSIKPGEILLAVDGDAVGPHTNLDSLLQNKVDRRVVLRIGSGGGPAKERDAIVRPISSGARDGTSVPLVGGSESCLRRAGQRRQAGLRPHGRYVRAVP